MSGTQGALRLIELASARMLADIGDMVEWSAQGILAGPGKGPSLGGVAMRSVHDVQVPASRIQLRQAAWGPDRGPLSLATLAVLAEGLPTEVRVQYTGLDPGTVFPAATGRVVLNLLLLAAEGLPAGGCIALAGGSGDLFIRIDGPGARWPAETGRCLVDEAQAYLALSKADTLQLGLTTLFASAAGIRLSLVVAAASRDEPPILRLGG